VLSKPPRPTQPAIAFFGSLTIDDLVFADGSTRWAQPGGNAAYSALGASIWTDKVEIVAPLGSDYPREIFRDKVDLARCRRQQHSLRNWGLYEEDGSRQFISRRSSRDWAHFCPRPADARSGVQIVAHVAAMPGDMAIELVKELRIADTSMISLDLDDHDQAGAVNAKRTIELVNAVDVFLPSWQDVQAIVSAGEPKEALRQLRTLAPKPRAIVLKCGAAGVFAHTRGTNQWLHVPAFASKVIDTTGAGDAFCGGFLARFAQDANPIESLLYGSVSASFCIERLGFEGLISATLSDASARLDLLRPLASSGAWS
jgi:sugar/nucleoside kinase (ribokinase family)